MGKAQIWPACTQVKVAKLLLILDRCNKGTFLYRRILAKSNKPIARTNLGVLPSLTQKHPLGSVSTRSMLLLTYGSGGGYFAMMRDTDVGGQGVCWCN